MSTINTTIKELNGAAKSEDSAFLLGVALSAIGAESSSAEVSEDMVEKHGDQKIIVTVTEKENGATRLSLKLVD